MKKLIKYTVPIIMLWSFSFTSADYSCEYEYEIAWEQVLYNKVDTIVEKLFKKYSDNKISSLETKLKTLETKSKEKIDYTDKTKWKQLRLIRAILCSIWEKRYELEQELISLNEDEYNIDILDSLKEKLEYAKNNGYLIPDNLTQKEVENITKIAQVIYDNKFLQNDNFKKLDDFLVYLDIYKIALVEKYIIIEELKEKNKDDSLLYSKEIWQYYYYIEWLEIIPEYNSEDLINIHNENLEKWYTSNLENSRLNLIDDSNNLKFISKEAIFLEWDHYWNGFYHKILFNWNEYLIKDNGTWDTYISHNNKSKIFQKEYISDILNNWTDWKIKIWFNYNKDLFYVFEDEKNVKAENLNNNVLFFTKKGIEIDDNWEKNYYNQWVDIFTTRDYNNLGYLINNWSYFELYLNDDKKYTVSTYRYSNNQWPDPDELIYFDIKNDLKNSLLVTVNTDDKWKWYIRYVKNWNTLFVEKIVWKASSCLWEDCEIKYTYSLDETIEILKQSPYKSDTSFINTMMYNQVNIARLLDNGDIFNVIIQYDEENKKPVYVVQINWEEVYKTNWGFSEDLLLNKNNDISIISNLLKYFDIVVNPIDNKTYILSPKYEYIDSSKYIWEEELKWNYQIKFDMIELK